MKIILKLVTNLSIGIILFFYISPHIYLNPILFQIIISCLISISINFILHEKDKPIFFSFFFHWAIQAILLFLYYLWFLFVLVGLAHSMFTFFSLKYTHSKKVNYKHIILMLLQGIGVFWGVVIGQTELLDKLWSSLPHTLLNGSFFWLITLIFALSFIQFEYEKQVGHK